MNEYTAGHWGTPWSTARCHQTKEEEDEEVNVHRYTTRRRRRTRRCMCTGVTREGGGGGDVIFECVHNDTLGELAHHTLAAPEKTMSRPAISERISRDSSSAILKPRLRPIIRWIEDKVKEGEEEVEEEEDDEEEVHMRTGALLASSQIPGLTGSGWRRQRRSRRNEGGGGGGG